MNKFTYTCLSLVILLSSKLSLATNKTTPFIINGVNMNEFPYHEKLDYFYLNKSNLSNLHCYIYYPVKLSDHRHKYPRYLEIHVQDRYGDDIISTHKSYYFKKTPIILRSERDLNLVAQQYLNRFIRAGICNAKSNFHVYTPEEIEALNNPVTVIQKTYPTNTVPPKTQTEERW